MGSDYGTDTMSLRLRDGREGGQQSIIRALNSFVRAVNVMDSTVMIPSRLRDMDISVNMNNGEGKVSVENNNELAILPAVGTKHADLYSFYTMLHAIKHELLSGGSVDSLSDGAPDSGVTADGDETNNKPTAAAFRYHLTSLLGMLRQMTATANYLTTRYEDELGPTNPHYSTWAM